MSKVLEANEKNYKIMSRVGGSSVAIGIIVLIFGLVCGIISIVNGGRLLMHKSDLMF